MASIWIHASELILGDGVRRKDGRRITEQDLNPIEDGAIVFEPRKKILWTGKTSDIPKKYLRSPKKNLKQERAVIPALVDCHNHLVFAGNRSHEFAARCAGATYQQIAEKGGGILTTITSTREAQERALLKDAVTRVEEARSFGVRTLEIKSGYGLSLESEIKLLRVAGQVRKKFKDMSFHLTFMGAHAFPKDKSRESYMKEILEEMLPQVAKAKLADSCDVFVDKGYFTVEEGEKILSQARSLGLATRLHADELADTGSAAMGARIGALSADHLLKVSSRGIEALARSQTVAVLLPGTALYLKEAYAPARALLDQGACVAVATDFNPGSCMSNSLPAAMTLAALYMGMSRAEIFAATTYSAAKALGLEARKGTLEPGRDADILALPFKRFEEMYYRFCWSPAQYKVIHS